MKRRNADCGKLRRPIKRNKITEGMYGSTTVLYMKFLVLWAIVITADFMFMFRFEFLWPFWLLLRSVHDSFKYKGLAFSVLFVCIAITSDLVCLFFIPVHWLLFAASTYVWVQYVWHTDKGICLPTIILWMLFVYLEAGIRWKDTRHMPHLDLCRPFAAHCIGYPVVTLGFGFKSYVGYRMRQRKQREVSKENEFYMQLLHQALPQEETPLDEAQIAATAAVTTVAPTTTMTSPLAATMTQSAQNSTSSPNGFAISALTSNAINTMTNGVLATQAQNSNQHHLHHQQHNQTPSEQQTHQGSSGSSISNHSSICGNNMNNLSSTSNSISTTITGGASSSNIDDKNYVQIGNGTGGGATSNGHIGGHFKSNRRSLDKESKNRIAAGTPASEPESKHNKSNNNYQQLHAGDNSHNSKEKSDWECSNYQLHQTQSSHSSGKDKSDDHRSNTNVSSSKKFNATINSSGATPTTNGNVLQYDVDEIVVEPVERTKGRRNRAKKDNSSKDNHHHHQQHNNSNNNNNNNSQSNNNNTNNANNNSSSNSNHVHNHHQQGNKDAATQSHNHTNGSNHINNSDTSSVSSSSSSSSTASISASSASVKPSASSTLSNLASKVVSKICESCLKLEADVKKYRSELSHMKQIENELRQKLESNLTTKSCLQAKQKECDELDKRIHDMTNARHTDMLQLQGVERRLAEERRQKQSLESQLSNEKKARKLAEEKAARPECSSQCKQRKQQMEEDFKQLRRDLKMVEDAKLIAEQHGRKWEQELRMFEAEIRNRDSAQPGPELLMNALAAMQDKNCTLEKNLSAETRVKLDLFSALGDAKRQLEISESRRRSKEDEILDLRAKIAQLLAVMPTDSLCLPSCSSTGASSMMRMNDTPPLQTVTGPASPMLSSLSVQVASGTSGHSLNVTRVVPTSAADYVQQATNDYVVSQQQHQCVGVVPVSVAQSVLVSGPSAGGASGSNLDPNATVYTPKCGGPPGGVVVVGGPGDA